MSKRREHSLKAEIGDKRSHISPARDCVGFYGELGTALHDHEVFHRVLVTFLMVLLLLFVLLT